MNRENYAMALECVIPGTSCCVINEALRNGMLGFISDTSVSRILDGWWDQPVMLMRASQHNHNLDSIMTQLAEDGKEKQQSYLRATDLTLNSNDVDCTPTIGLLELWLTNPALFSVLPAGNYALQIASFIIFTLLFTVFLIGHIMFPQNQWLFQGNGIDVRGPFSAAGE